MWRKTLGAQTYLKNQSKGQYLFQFQNIRKKTSAGKKTCMFVVHQET